MLHIQALKEYLPYVIKPDVIKPTHAHIYSLSCYVINYQNVSFAFDIIMRVDLQEY
jgi:hypothetical protein